MNEVAKMVMIDFRPVKKWFFTSSTGFGVTEGFEMVYHNRLYISPRGWLMDKGKCFDIDVTKFFLGKN